MTKQHVLSLIDKLADKTLSFGCLVKYEDEKYGYFVEKCCGNMLGYYRVMDVHPKTNVDFSLKSGIYSNDCYFHESKIKIIGHPVRLHDCLKVIRNHFGEGTTWFTGRPSMVIHFGEHGDFTWILDQEDDLRHQPEAAEFLYTILFL